MITDIKKVKQHNTEYINAPVMPEEIDILDTQKSIKGLYNYQDRPIIMKAWDDKDGDHYEVIDSNYINKQRFDKWFEAVAKEIRKAIKDDDPVIYKGEMITIKKLREVLNEKN